MAAPLALKTLLGNYPVTRALRSGELVPASFAFDFADVKVPNRAFKRVVRELEFDVAELALVTYFQAKAFGKPLALIPAVVGAGRFQHHCLVWNTDRPRVSVAQLAGKRIGIRAINQTTVTWVRGVLAEEYGVDLDSIRWVTYEDGHLAEYADPAGVERAPAGASAVDMLRPRCWPARSMPPSSAPICRMTRGWCRCCPIRMPPRAPGASATAWCRSTTWWPCTAASCRSGLM